MLNIQKNFGFICICFMVITLHGNVQGLGSSGVSTRGFSVIKNSEEDTVSSFDSDVTADGNTDGQNNGHLGSSSNIQIRVRDPTYVFQSDAVKGGFRPGMQNHGHFYSYQGRYNQGPNVQINPKSTSGIIAHDISPTVERIIHHTDDNNDEGQPSQQDRISEELQEEAVRELRQAYFQNSKRAVTAVKINSGRDKKVYRIRSVGESNEILPEEGGMDPPPPHEDVARMARFIVRNSNWTSAATISSRSPTTGFPFVNVFSVSDGPLGVNSTGVPYMYLTPLDISVVDLKKDPRASLTMSLAQGDYCRARSYDPEDPRCAHVILTGNFVKIESSTSEERFARKALFTRHPEMSGWPKDHGWFFAKLDISHVLVLDYFGGAKTVTPEEYFNANN